MNSEQFDEDGQEAPFMAPECYLRLAVNALNFFAREKSACVVFWRAVLLAWWMEIFCDAKRQLPRSRHHPSLKYQHHLSRRLRRLAFE